MNDAAGKIEFQTKHIEMKRAKELALAHMRKHIISLHFNALCNFNNVLSALDPFQVW